VQVQVLTCKWKCKVSVQAQVDVIEFLSRREVRMIYERPEGAGTRAIGYELRGEGPAVLLLHPFPFDRRFWSDTKLPGFRLVAIDARGFGESALTESELSIDDLADDAIALLDHLGIPMAAAVGSSMGGYVALSLAARHPQRLSALALVGTRADGDGPNARANRDAAAAEIRKNGPGGYLDGVAVRLCGRSSTEVVRDRVRRLSDSASPDFSRALPATLLALRDRADRSALLPRLQLPTMIVVGDEDAVTPPDEARAMKRAIPGAQLVELAQAGHLPSLERPEATLRVLAAFLETTLASP